MSISMILMLFGSGYLLLGECRVDAEIYGTYNTFDHLGHYSPPPSPSSSSSTSGVRSNRYDHNSYHNHNYNESNGIILTASLQTVPQQQQQQQHYQQQAASQQQSISSAPPPVQPQPLQAPQTAPPSVTPNILEDDSIAKPFDTAKNPTTTSSSVSSSSLSASTPATARVPLYMYNPGLARRLSVSTFMMGSVLYGLSLLPALLAVGVGSGMGPFAGLLGGLSGGKRRKKRRIRRSPVMMQQQQQHQYPTSASPPPFIPSTMAYKYREMPFLDHRSSHRFLALMENTMEVRKITNPICKKNYVCKVYQAALSISNDPKLPDMETAIIDTFGIAAERTGYKVDVIHTVKQYLEPALVGMTRQNCDKIFTPCNQQILRYFPPFFTSDKKLKDFKDYT